MAKAFQESMPLWRQLQATAGVIAAVRKGSSGTAAVEAVDASLRPGVQALAFQVWRNLGRAQALRSQLVSRLPAPGTDALLCVALALAWNEDEAPYDAAVRRFPERQPTRLRPRAHTAVARVGDGVSRLFVREQRRDRLARVELAEDVGHLADAIRDRAASGAKRVIELRKRLEVEREVRRVRIGRLPDFGFERGKRDHGRAVEGARGRRMRERRMVVESEVALEPHHEHGARFALRTRVDARKQRERATQQSLLRSQCSHDLYSSSFSRAASSSRSVGIARNPTNGASGAVCTCTRRIGVGG